MKYLKSKLLLFISALLALTVICLTAVIATLYYRTSVEESEKNSSYLAAAYKQSVDTAMDTFRNELKRTAQAEYVTSGSISKQEQTAQLEKEAKLAGFDYFAVADAQGKTSRSDSIADQIYFQEALKGNTYIASPSVNSSGVLTLMMGTPIGSGKQVLYGEISYDTFSGILKDIKIGADGYAFIVSKDAVTVVHPDKSTVENPVDYLTLSQKDPAYQPIANIYKQIVAGKTGTGYSVYKGTRRLVGFTPLAGPEGWGIAVTTPVVQLMSNLWQAMWISFGLGILLIVLSTIVVRIFAKRITQPILAATHRLELLEQGDLHTEVELVNGRDESARLMAALQNTVNGLRSYISDISHVLSRVVEKDLTVKSGVTYVGDFEPIQAALDTILQALNQTFTSITQSALQVHSGSEQVALGAQNLAENSFQQATAVDHLTSSMADISEHVGINAERSASVKQLSEETIVFVNQGNEQMEEMLHSMNQIDASSKEILNIIKVINDIAFQTNILALNAAVEASRAGSAGKGFAVVADEVRNLAARSAEAAENTTALIEKSIGSVSSGMKIADQTADSLHQIVEKVNHVNTLISGIADATQQQAQTLGELDKDMNRISSATQTNSATAEESAATSEELFTQSKLLEELMQEFKIV